MRQFQIAHALSFTLLYAIAFASWRWIPELGFILTAGISGVLTGLGLFAFSDSLDPRPIDQRNWLAWWLNLAGLLVLSASLILTGYGGILLIIWFN